MSTDSNQEFREAVRANTDIVALIGESVSLQPRNGGREYVGLCPFHDDHNPSLHVYPDRQSFRCWVCDTGGDCFEFVKEREKLGFRDVLELLARRANIPIPKSFGRDSAEKRSEKARQYEILTWASQQFHRALLSDPRADVARRYLASRGFSESVVREYRLGYHPRDIKWLQNLCRGAYSVEDLLAARLVGQSENRPGYYDFFSDRVLFPIRDERSQTVGFGGRHFPGSSQEERAKYWNSPESPLFQKSRLLYGLDRARDAIRKDGIAIVVEGYTDCISCQLAGVENVVATLGTALTESHVLLLKRFARRVVLTYDGDEAGQMAASRAVERLLAQDVDLRILTLPDGLDPADFITQHGADAFQAAAAQAIEGWEFQLKTAITRHGLETLDGRQRVLDEQLSVLARVPRMSEHVRQGLYLASLAERLHVNEDQVRQRLRELRSQSPSPARSMERSRNEESPSSVERPLIVKRLFSGRLSRDDRLECDLLEMILARPELVEFARADCPVESIQHPYLRQLLRLHYEHAEPGRPVEFSRLLGLIEDVDLKRIAVWLDEQARIKNVAERLLDENGEVPEHCPELFRRSLENIAARHDDQSHRAIVEKIRESADGATGLSPAVESLIRQAADIQKKRATKRAPL